jgi:hypothetical protein
MLIEISFSARMSAAIVEGEKTATTRFHQHGSVGDRFFVKFGNRAAVCELTDVRLMPLSEIVENYHKQEGFITQQSMIDEWTRLYPAVGYDPRAYCWLHVFEIISRD